METSAFSGGPVQTEAPETTEPQAAQSEPQAQTSQTVEENRQPDGEQKPADPVLSALEGMRQQIDALSQRQEPAGQNTDLLSALEAEPEPEVGPAEVEIPAGQQQQQYQDAEAQQQLAALQALIRDEASQMVTPWMQEQQEKEVRALQERYPDIMDQNVLEKVEGTVQEFVDATGDESLVRNAAFIEKAYKLAKAELAEATAAPAEQVATQGASLETNAGQTQTGAPSTDEEYINAVFGTGRVESAFTWAPPPIGERHGHRHRL